MALRRIVLLCLATVMLSLPEAILRAADDAPSRRPNILFLIADDWGWNHAGAYGCTWIKTPTFDRLAREGVLFKNCFTNNPKCSPCRASILAGRSSWQLEEACCHFGLFRNKFPVYTDLLESAGYDVACTGKGWGPGNWKDGGFVHNPAGREYNKHPIKPPLHQGGRFRRGARFH